MNAALFFVLGDSARWDFFRSSANRASTLTSNILSEGDLATATFGPYFAVAETALAGGVDSPVRAGKPVGAPTPPLVSGSGAYVVDVSGRRYIDYLCAYGPVLLGHGDPRIAAAVARALHDGAVLGSTHPQEIHLAGRLQKRFPSMERMRFVTTGTEACMSAVRVARAFTRRPLVVRFEGCYHGHSDAMIFSAGASSMSTPSLQAGVTPGVKDEVIVVAYNNVEALEQTLARHGSDIAAVIVEPVCGNMGLCLPAPGYLNALREFASKAGAVLIFDEVITGLRLAPGGAQEVYGVAPDLTCIGKSLGGGLPIAAFGGRADIMSCLAPTGGVFVGGTFSGNPACVAAAHALLDALEAEPDIYPRLATLAAKLAAGLTDIIGSRGRDYPVVQCGSMVDFMFRDGLPHSNFAQAKTADAGAYARFYHAMLERGILLPPSQMELMFLTAAHTQIDIDQTLAAAREALV